ncbi:MAG: isoleucine--tRNA ligase, partial [Alphaproteobacteria bacterium]|nr:isoleucine--tRNA ligase [Alphaproteobacteria bacterium]
EPQLLARWQKMGLYEKQRAAAKGRDKFILHYGPPFANGHIHLGHLLSHTLKDIVCRAKQLEGFDAPLVPGYDCHGLPIEWKVEEEFRTKGKNDTKDTDPVGFRRACRDYAAHWSGIQTEELQRIGILGDWKNPYSTMHKKSEALIASEIHKFLMSGSLYRGSKPVMWSIPEQTALAEAEVEYKDVTSDTVYVKFPVKKGPQEFAGASVVIWTTTPWTLPGNRAIAYGDDMDYVMVDVTGVADDSLVKTGDRVFVAQVLLPAFKTAAKITAATESTPFKGSAFQSIACHHPLHGRGYDFDVPLLAGDFVTTDAGTGFVHIAPGHGEDDYTLGIKNHIEVPQTVGGDGKYFSSVPLFAGLEVYLPNGKKGPANKMVTQAIADAGHLVAKAQITHSYPHSWRSKAPVIFRNTPQWFISMDTNDLRRKAIAEIARTRFVPERGRNRIGAMIEQRGDWCVSRQRAWGVPIAVFVDKKSGQPLKDDAVNKRIYEVFEKEGSDAWFDHPPQHFLGDKYETENFEQVRDIIDVWFESGSTQGFVLEDRPELKRPADLYLEGSDQHRGWFQSSLLVGVGTRGNAPYKTILTHGFILDEKGYKMSKSVGNVTSPIKLTEMYGADILRLWVASSGYTDDIKFGENILKGHAETYRRIRSTFCYLLGSLGEDFRKAEDKDLSDLDKWVLHKLHETDGLVKSAIADFDFVRMTTAVHNLCARELSAFYFDVCKDTLYCEAKDGMKRRAVLTVLDHVFNFLVHWLAPVLSYTAEEAWLAYKGLGMDDENESIHLSSYPQAPAAWHQPALDDKWQKILAVRGEITKALEVAREQKTIGGALEAAATFRAADTALAQILKSVDMAEICITSGFSIETGDGGITVAKASGEKCARCWKYTEDVGADARHPALCARCSGVVAKEHPDLKAVA